MQRQGFASRKTLAVRRGRWAVLWALGGFIALQLAYHFPLAHWLPQIRDVEYGNKLADLRQHLADKPSDQPLVIAFGSSLTAMALKPTELATCQPTNPQGPLVFNYSINSGMVMVQLLLLRRLLADGIRPDCVLVETQPLFFLSAGKDNPRRKIRDLPATRVEWRDLPVLERYYWHHRQFENEWRLDQAAPWYSHRHLLQNWLMSTWVPQKKRIDNTWIHTDNWGWLVWPELIERCRDNYRLPNVWEPVHHYVEGLSHFEVNDIMDSTLRELIGLCQRENIRVVTVWVPESSHYRGHYSAALTQRIDGWFQRLQAETGVPFVNARDWVADEDFMDGWHVAPEGATTYTRRLETEVLQPIFHDARTPPLR